MTDNVPDRTAILALWEHRKARLDRLYVKTPAISRALELLVDFRENGYRGPDGSACCFLVSGLTNAGKSRLFSSYYERPECQPSDDRLPVVRFSAPSPFNLRDFFAEFLLALKTRDFAERHQIGHMKRRVVSMLAERRTEMVMVDDFQHIIDKKGGNSPYWAADTIKTMVLDGAKVPMVFNGLPITEEIFTRNTQLLSRRKGIVRLAPDGWTDDPVGQEQFKVAISVFERAADFPERAKVGEAKLALDSDPVAERIHRGTGGLRGNLYNLFKQATELGTKRGASSLSIDLLSEAHAILSDAGRDWVNVFTVKVLPPIEALDDSRVTRLHKKKKAA